ncbi:hypothetical protein F5Y13DRAFT_204797 [Hypoxylon sp. FL1857]|nr:hypothetical protein F5Y13DRAFT_204797 [Hypoxylon sp. FL1857]
MALNSKFEGSIFSAKNENNLALLHGNVDFSLIKVEVPKQFEGLGKALSKYRLENAENGPQHRTARRLGALFEQIIPNIDALVSAYGERSSDIAKLSKLESKATEYGPFSGHVGVDGTSIYAAVSSGNSVIALHLLACMLARMFSSAEATAIWAQLVDCRLAEIKRESNNSQVQGLAALFAAEQGSQITRDDLALWDASARAWVDAANQVKKFQDTQLKLIIKNIPSIQNTGTTYSSIIENWIVAMTTIHKLIQGVPQEVTNSSVLLGLMSWHIYPDLNIFSPATYIAFKDHLVKIGGVITLGLEQKGENCTGVTWSVSLSHLRYYGDPIVIEKSSEEGGRITAEELRFVTFGCVLGSWDKPASVDVIKAIECFVALGDALQLGDTTRMSYDDPSSWITLLIDTARTYLLSDDNGREIARHFIDYGRRRDTEASTAILRRLAKACNFHRDDCIIVNRPRRSLDTTVSNIRDDVDWTWELVSAIPAPFLTRKRSQDGKLRTIERHVRWVHVDRVRKPLLQRYIDVAETPDVLDDTIVPNDLNPYDLIFIGQAGSEAETFHNCDCRKSGDSCNTNCPCRKRGFKCTSVCTCLYDFSGIEESLRCKNARRREPASEVRDEEVYWLSVRSTNDLYDDTMLTNVGHAFNWNDPPHPYIERGSRVDDGDKGMYEVSFLGSDVESPLSFVDSIDSLEDGPHHPNNSSYRMNAVGRKVNFRSVQVNGSAGLFLTNKAAVDVPRLSLSELTEIFKSGALDPILLKVKLKEIGRTGIVDFSSSLKGAVHYSDMFFKSLKAVSAISDLYDWPEATISIGITRQPLGSALWTDNVWNHSMIGGNANFWRSTKFSCLAMLESGGHDIRPDQVELVMAMVTGNSIYASEALLQDPIESDCSSLPQFKGIRRLTGNVGHAGIVMLVPPPTPRVLQQDTTWRLDKVNTFDGQLQSPFKQTSLHLKLTEYKIPLAGARSAIDPDVVIREALISVYDARIPGCTCLHQQVDDKHLGRLLVENFGCQLKAITTWDGLLSYRENLMDGEIGTVCVYNNWFARLAATALVTQMGSQTVALPSHCVCSCCGRKLLEHIPWASSTDNYAPPKLLII